MRIILSATVLVASLSASSAFTPSASVSRLHQGIISDSYDGTTTATTTELFSSVKQRPGASTATPKTTNGKETKISIDIENNFQKINDESNEIIPLTGEEINARLHAQLEKLREKDRTSKMIAKEVGCFSKL